jgi:hypothetical protein
MAVRRRRARRDIKDPRLLYLKGGLFLIGGVLSATLLLVEMLTLKNLVLLGLTVWCFSRAYYFAFYVIQHYVDSSYRFAGLGSVVTYLLRRRRRKR